MVDLVGNQLGLGWAVDCSYDRALESRHMGGVSVCLYTSGRMHMVCVYRRFVVTHSTCGLVSVGDYWQLPMMEVEGVNRPDLLQLLKWAVLAVSKAWVPAGAARVGAGGKTADGGFASP